MLAKLGTELFLQICNEALHDAVYLLVAHGLLLFLKDEVDGITLFPDGQVLSFVDIEQLNLLKQLAL